MSLTQLFAHPLWLHPQLTGYLNLAQQKLVEQPQPAPYHHLPKSLAVFYLLGILKTDCTVVSILAALRHNHPQVLSPQY